MLTIYRQALRMIWCYLTKATAPFLGFVPAIQNATRFGDFRRTVGKIIGGGEQEAVKLRDSVAVTMGLGPLGRYTSGGKQRWVDAPQPRRNGKSSFTVAMESWREAPGAVDRSIDSQHRSRSKPSLLP